MTWRLPPERKAGEKVGCAGKVRISLGGNAQQQLRPGLSPALAQPPLRIVLHTRAYIFRVNTKPSLYQGPFVFKFLEQSVEIRNELSFSDWMSLAACILQFYMCMHVMYIQVHACFPPNVHVCLCVHSVFCPCREAILRTSGLEVSVSGYRLLSSAAQRD